MKRILSLTLSLAILLSVFALPTFAEEVQETTVSVCVTPEDARVVLSVGIGYTYVEETVQVQEDGSYLLAPGDYTVTVTKDGFYASVFSFTVTETGKVTAVDNKGNVKDYLENGVFTVALSEFVPSERDGAWDGVTLDVSWYDENAETLTIKTSAQFAGFAAIVNGIYNAEITTIWDDADGDGTLEDYTPEEYAALEHRKIRPHCSTSGTGGNNLVTTDSYWYGTKSDGVTPSDFNGQTVLLACDVDMGGWETDDGWTGARYMTVGGQSLMHYIDYAAWKSDGFSHLGSSFNGTLDGQGHYVRNIFCDRYGAGTNYGDSSSVGLIGRLGCHDNDDTALLAVDPGVKNIAVTGYVYGRRSVGGIVGKTGQSTASRLGDGSTGCIIENCMNFAEVHNTDAKGCGGIVGASWNKGVIRNCANFGDVSSTYTCPTGGIAGSNEIKLESCYSIGQISAAADSYAMGIGTNNGGASTITDCYWLTGTAPGGGYFKGKGDIEITDNYHDRGLSAEEFMKSQAFVDALNGDGDSRSWVLSDTYPIPRVFTVDEAKVVSVEKTADPEKLLYVAGQTFDTDGLAIYAVYSDDTQELVEDYAISPDRPLQVGDTSVVISGTFGGIEYRYEYAVTVIEAELVDLRITKLPNNCLYASDETFTPSGMVVSAYFSNAPETGVALEYGAYDWSLDGNTVTVTYTYFNTTLTASCEILWLDTPKPQKEGNGYYGLSCENDLLWLANQVNALGFTTIKGILLQNITVNSGLFDGIGTTGNAFIGSFDGDGHTVTLENTKTGLFSVVGAAQIVDLTVDGAVASTATSGTAAFVSYVAAMEKSETLRLENCINRARVEAPSYAGGLVGKSMTSAVCLNTCRNEGEIIASGDYVGGLVGYAAGGSTLESCTNCGSVTGCGHLGGVVGALRVSSGQMAAVISDCNNLGEISGSDRVGGIAGYLAGSGENETAQVLRCYNDASVSGSDAVGGIVGYAFYKEDRIESCYNLGAVTGGSSKAVGGIVGYNRSSVVDVYNLGTVIGETAVGGIVGTAAQVNSVIENAYHAGTLQAESCGVIIGYASADVTVENCHCLEGQTCGMTLAGKTVTGAASVHTETELMNLAEVLGDTFQTSNVCPQHYPTLIWQTGTPHTWDDGSLALAPTCSVEGEYTYLCAICGMSRTERVAAISCHCVEFTDIPENAWYHDAIDFMVEEGFMLGMGKNTFEPELPLTRAQLVTVIYRIAGSPEVDTSEIPFTDIPEGEWYTGAVIWAAENGVVNGYPDGTFLPENEITREQIAAILYRYMGAKPVEDCVSPFPDAAEISEYALDAMNWAVSCGLITGSAQNGSISLLPQQSATRAQIAQILTRWLQS